LILKYSLIDGFSIRFNDNSEVDYFLLGHHGHNYTNQPDTKSNPNPNCTTKQKQTKNSCV